MNAHAHAQYDESLSKAEAQQMQHDYARLKQKLNALAADAVTSRLWLADTDGEMVISAFLTKAAADVCEISP